MPAASTSSRRAAQRGGFFIGVVVGLLVGLALALGVALYVTKVPLPFIDKVPQRTAEQDAAEIEKNRNWDPNAPLSGKNAERPATPPQPAAGAGSVPPGVVLPPPVAGDSTRDPAAILSGGVTPPAPGVSTASAPAALLYYVQAGAYARTDEAEAQRAQLAIQGFESKISEREQAGRTMYRVRIGPFNQRADAETVKATLAGVGMESALVSLRP
jgi:cell division protein FtsN